jgi:hypothetical protein
MRVDEVAGSGSGRSGFPRHRMLCNFKQQGSKLLDDVWQILILLPTCVASQLERRGFEMN